MWQHRAESSDVLGSKSKVAVLVEACDEANFLVIERSNKIIESLSFVSIEFFRVKNDDSIFKEFSCQADLKSLKSLFLIK